MGKKRNVKKASLILGTVVLTVGVVFFIGLQLMLRNFSREISKVEINQINLAGIEDGLYIGEYNFNESVGATLGVTIANNEIIDIEILEHRAGLGKKAEIILQQVIDAQSLEVDSVSGATGSSTVLLKAIENALSSNN